MDDLLDAPGALRSLWLPAFMLSLTTTAALALIADPASGNPSMPERETHTC
jgi:hypothetical protein